MQPSQSAPHTPRQVPDHLPPVDPPKQASNGAWQTLISVVKAIAFRILHFIGCVYHLVSPILKATPLYMLHVFACIDEFFGITPS